MKKAILTAGLLLSLLWCLGEPADGRIDAGWLIGEIIGFAVMFICGRLLWKNYPELR